METRKDYLWVIIVAGLVAVVFLFYGGCAPKKVGPVDLTPYATNKAVAEGMDMMGKAISHRLEVIEGRIDGNLERIQRNKRALDRREEMCPCK